MDLIRVRGQQTLESQNEIIRLSKPDFGQLSRIPARDDEKDYYIELESLINASLNQVTESTSRQFLIQNPECISTIHFLLGRKIKRMNVYMRSSDAARLASDIGFLTRQAKKYSVDKLTINIGSFHVLLENEKG
jgi:hypothetical protein